MVHPISAAHPAAFESPKPGHRPTTIIADFVHGKTVRLTSPTLGSDVKEAVAAARL